MGEPIKAYWNEVVLQRERYPYYDLWRAHMQDAYQSLLDRWVQGNRCHWLMKTDLFEEAVSPYNSLDIIQEIADRVTGIDISYESAALSGKHLSGTARRNSHVTVCDVRSLAFRANTFNMIFSNSTLDHFPDKDDIGKSIREIYRVLTPDGRLILTLDNIQNPIVRLRNSLPYKWLRSLKFVPYCIGTTLSRQDLIHLLQESGFHISHVTWIDHSPRFWVIQFSRLLRISSQSCLFAFYRRILHYLEKLEMWPCRAWTGHFIAVDAVKKSAR